MSEMFYLINQHLRFFNSERAVWVKQLHTPGLRVHFLSKKTTKCHWGTASLLGKLSATSLLSPSVASDLIVSTGGMQAQRSPAHYILPTLRMLWGIKQWGKSSKIFFLLISEQNWKSSIPSVFCILWACFKLDKTELPDRGLHLWGPTEGHGIWSVFIRTNRYQFHSKAPPSFPFSLPRLLLLFFFPFCLFLTHLSPFYYFFWS